MKRVSLLLLVLAFFLSCQNQGQAVKTQPAQPQGTQQQPVQTQPQTTQTQPQTAQPQVTQTQPVNDPGKTQDQGGVNTSAVPDFWVFDPSSISQEEKDTAKIEIQQLIQELNGIIRAKNYNAWVSYLDPNYFSVISSAEYLDRISKSTVLVKQKITLRSAKDYFTHVVVPSRTNDRVDDIEFESQNRVKAYTVNNKGEKLRLYDLEKSGSDWKIIN